TATSSTTRRSRVPCCTASAHPSSRACARARRKARLALRMMRPGARISRYTVVAPVGRGEPGGLFEVHDDAGRTFVRRSPVGDLEDSADAVTKQFFPLADALRSIAHNNLVVLFDVFVEAGQLFMVTEKVSGRGLATAIDGGLGPRKSLVIA